MVDRITPSGRGLGWRKQNPDPRDAAFVFSTVLAPSAIPNYIDLRRSGNLPAVYDQGQLGSCTGNAIAGAIEFDRIRQKLPSANQVPSRLMIYYGEREMEGTVMSDAGAEIRDGIKFVARYGTCFETGPNSWPYNTSLFKVKPPAGCYDAAVKDRAVSYMPVPQNTLGLRGCIAEGFPVIFGFTCYEELDSPEVMRTGRLPIPRGNEAPMGGHAVMAVGYDDKERNFLIRNSWGKDWGLHGYFLMPYEYLLRTDLSSDFWTIRVVG